MISVRNYDNTHSYEHPMDKVVIMLIFEKSQQICENLRNIEEPLKIGLEHNKLANRMPNNSHFNHATLYDYRVTTPTRAAFRRCRWSQPRHVARLAELARS